MTSSSASASLPGEARLAGRMLGDTAIIRILQAGSDVLSRIKKLDMSRNDLHTEAAVALANSLGCGVRQDLSIFSPSRLLLTAFVSLRATATAATFA
jgi:hypothetical protein